MCLHNSAATARALVVLKGVSDWSRDNESQISARVRGARGGRPVHGSTELFSAVFTYELLISSKCLTSTCNNHCMSIFSRST